MINQRNWNVFEIKNGGFVLKTFAFRMAVI